MNPVLRTYLEPYYKMHKGMVIHWHRQEASDTLYYRKEGEGAWTTVSSSTKAFPLRSETIHYVVLDNLDSDQGYEFRFEGEDDGDIRLFKTLPARLNRTIRYSVISDHQQRTDITGSGYISLLSRIGTINSDFAVWNGDYIMCWGNITDSVNTTAWASLIDTWSEYLVDSNGYHIPLLGMTGNHEVWPPVRQIDPESVPQRPVNPPNFLRLFFYTGWDDSNPRSHDGYSFINAGNYMALFQMDTDHNQSVYDQTEWLKEMYATLGNRYRYVVPILHMIPFPPVRSFNMVEQPAPYDVGYRVVVEELRQNWHPMWQKFGARFVSVGHDHALCVSPRINVNPANPQGHVDEENYESLIYCGSGACHPSTVRTVQQAAEWWIDQAESTANFWSYTIEAEKMTAIAYRTDGTTFGFREQTVKNIAYGKPRLALAA